MSTIHERLLAVIKHHNGANIFTLKRELNSSKARVRQALDDLTKAGKITTVTGLSGPKRYVLLGGSHATAPVDNEISVNVEREITKVRLNLPKNVVVDLTRTQAIEVVKQIGLAFQ